MRRAFPMLGGLMLLLVLAACGRLTPPEGGPAVAAFPGDNGKIAFTRNLDGNVDIYVMNADGSDQTRLTSHPEYDNSPAWSPDGSRIAFSRFMDIYPYNGDIYLMNADGSDQINLTRGPTTGPTRPSGQIDSDPAWSPDASQLAFSYTYDAPYGDHDIYRMNADGSDRTVLTFDSWFNVSAAWSPDGTKIAFSSDQDRNHEIFVMDTDGSDPINLTEHPAGDGAPAWSPDGSQIAFQSDRDGNTEIYLMNADGSDQMRLTNNSAYDGAPTWSPDGNQIAFQSDRDGNTEIYLMNNDGSDQINLTNHPAYDGSPDWQPILAPPSPAEAIASLMDQVDSLDLIKHTERSLLSLLQQAQQSAERGNTRATLGKLRAFINQVEAQSGKKIHEGDAEALIAAADRIIGGLGRPTDGNADLTLTVTGPASASAGDEIASFVALTAENLGSAAAPGTLTAGSNGYMIDVVLSSDQLVPAGFAEYSPNFGEDVLLQGGRVSNTVDLAPGASEPYGIVGGTIPADTPAGSYFVCSQIDPDQQIAELDEGNNVACVPIEISAAPSFVITSYQLSPEPPATLPFSPEGAPCPEGGTVFVTGTYEKNVVDPVLIFARPFSEGSPTPQYGATGSVEHVDLVGSFEQDFCLRDDVTNEQRVDQLRLFIERPSPSGELLYEQFADVDYLFTQPVSMIRQFGGSSNDEALGVATDTSRNIYVTGYTSGELGGSTSAGLDDLFLVKYDPAGNRMWARQFGSSSSERALGVGTDASGNVYLSGWTQGALGGNALSGRSDFFIIKYDDAGNRIWTRLHGSSSDDGARNMAIDTDGNIYVTGYTWGSLDGNAYAGGGDVFLVKYDSDGNRVWSRQLGTGAWEQGTNVAADVGGNIYVTGYTLGGLDGNSNAGNEDLFLLKYDSAGNRIWTRQFGSSSEEFAWGVATDTSGDIYVTGWTRGGLDGNSNAGDWDVFIVKYDGTGNKIWTQQFGTSDDDRTYGAATNASGIYVTGTTKGELDGNSNAGGVDFFVTRYDAAGNRIWTRQLGTSGSDRTLGMTVDTTGGIYVAGATSGDLAGSGNAGGLDMFLVKFAP